MANDPLHSDAGDPVDQISSSSRLTAEQAAQLLDQKARTLWRWRKQSYGPPFRKIGRRRRVFGVGHCRLVPSAEVRASGNNRKGANSGHANEKTPAEIDPKSRFLGKRRLRRAHIEEAKRLPAAIEDPS